MNAITLGTRASALALAQARLTTEALARAFPSLKIAQAEFTTRGDQKLDLSLIRSAEAGGKGLFTKELEEALLERRIDVAVHSLKDVPAKLADNPHLDQAQYRATLANLHPYDRAQLLDGDWDVRPPGSRFRREWFPVVEAATPARRSVPVDRATTGGQKDLR